MAGWIIQVQPGLGYQWYTAGPEHPSVLWSKQLSMQQRMARLEFRW